MCPHAQSIQTQHTPVHVSIKDTQRCGNTRKIIIFLTRAIIHHSWKNGSAQQLGFAPGCFCNIRPTAPASMRSESETPQIHPSEGNIDVEARQAEPLFSMQGVLPPSYASHPITITESTQAKDSQLYAYPKFDDMGFGRIAMILCSLGLASFLFAIDQTIVATSIAGIGSALRVKGSLTWISTSYLLTTTVFQPIAGRLADAIGVTRLLVIDIWIFILGNLIAGLSKNLNQLVAGRLISGVGGSGLLSLSVIIVSQLTNERQRGSYLNLINAAFSIADAVGPLVGGGFVKSGNWRWTFLFNVPFGPVITIMLVRTLRLPRPSSQVFGFRATLAKLDFAGMIMLISTLSFLVVALNLGGQAFAWNSPPIIGMFCAAAVSFVAFVIAEKYAKMPVAPLTLFIQWQWRNVPLILVIRCLLFFHLFSTSFYLPVYLQVIGVSPIVSAALITPFLSMATLSSVLTSYIASKFSHVRPMFLFALAVLPVGMGLMSTLNETSSIGLIVGYSLVSGFGFGCGTQITMVIAQVGLPADELSTVTALVSSAPNLGGVLGIGLIGTLINNMFRHNVSQIPFTSGLDLNDVVGLVFSVPPGEFREAIIKAYIRAWNVSWWVLAGVAVVQFILALFLRPVEFSDGTDKPDGAKVG